MRVSAIFFTGIAIAHAQSGYCGILFYGGYPDFENGLPNAINARWEHAQVYDDFRVTAPVWEIETAHSIITFAGRGYFEPDMGHIEIRQGVSRGDGGTLVFEATLPVSLRKIDCGFLYCWYELKAENVDVALPRGDYFLSFAPIGSGEGEAWLLSTSGEGSVGEPIANGNAFIDSRTFNYDFVPAEDILGDDRRWDFSMALGGQVVPAPGAIAILALAGGFVPVRRRARREPAMRVV